MALIKNIDEVREVLPQLVSNLNASSNLPDFDAVEEKHLVPLIGEALYEDLVSKYDDNSLSEDEEAVLKNVRRLIAAYAFLEDLATTHVFLTDVGVRVYSTGDMQKAAGWEYKELKKFLENKAFDATEVLLLYLWRHKADLPLWTDSDAYESFEGLLIRTGTDFSEQYKLFQPMRTFYALKTLLRDQQDSYVLSAIGADLLNYFLQLEDPTADESKIIRQLKKGLAFFTIKHACDHYVVRFGDSGFTIVSEFGGDREGDDSGRAGASAHAIKRLKDACDKDGKNFISKAKTLAIELRKTDAASEYITAFDNGPLYKKMNASAWTSGNERRKIFRF